MASWPATLPAYLIGSYSETSPDNVIRSTVDKGAAKLRRRTTANIRRASFSMFLTPAQVATLDAFYLTNAALEFDFTNPRTGAAVKARFTAPPEFGDVTGKNFNCAVELEIMP